jgi:uncharacterized protein YndB with AHSA1/START domain
MTTTSTTTDSAAKAGTITNVYRVFIESTPERVWEAITDPEWNDRYGYRAKAHYELQTGGAYVVDVTPEMAAHGAPDVIIDGEVLECDPPNRLVQTWHAYFDPATAAEPTTRLTWELHDLGNGVTELTLTHELENAPITNAITSGQAKEGGGGWAWILSDLKTFLERGEATPN